MTAFIVFMLLQFNQVLMKYGCQKPRIFALEKEVVLSCEAGHWPENKVIERTSVLLSALSFSYPYGEKYSVVLRKFNIPVVQITVSRREIVEFLSGKIEDFPSRWRVYNLKGKIYRFHGLPMSIISAVVNPLKEDMGRIEVKEFSCPRAKPRIVFSYAFVDRGLVMFIIKGEEGRITDFMKLKGSGEETWKGSLSLSGEVRANLYLWKGNWVRVWEGKTLCKKEEK